NKKAGLAARFSVCPVEALLRELAPGASALGELETAAGLRLAVLLSLDRAAVAGQQPALLQHAAQLRHVIGARLGNAMTHRASLAGQPAAGNLNVHVVLAVAVGRHDRLLQHHLQHRPREIGRKFLVVDGDLAGAWAQPDARYSVLALAGRVGAAMLVEL